MDRKKSIVVGVISKIGNNSIYVNGTWYGLSKYPDKGTDFTKLRENQLYEFIVLDNKYVISYKEISNISEEEEEEFKKLISDDKKVQENVEETISIIDAISDINESNVINDNKEKVLINTNQTNTSFIDNKIKNDLTFFIKDYKIAKMNALSHAIELYKLKVEKENVKKIDVKDVIKIADEIFNYIFYDDKDILSLYKNQNELIRNYIENKNIKKEV